MLASLSLKDTGPAEEMSFQLGSRVNLFAGDNGLGKSFVLDVAWFALTGTWPQTLSPLGALPHPHADAKPTIEYTIRRDSQDFAFRSSFDFPNQHWTTLSPSQEASKRLDLVVYARVDGGFSIWDPMRRADHSRFPFGVRSFAPVSSFQFSQTEVWDGLRSRDDPSRVLCNGLLADWRLWQLEKGSDFATLAHVLEVLSPHEPLVPGESAMRLHAGDARDIPTLQLPYGLVPITHASAGMKRILAFAYLLLWLWREHRQAAQLQHAAPVTSLVVLFDEVEAHLHPQWQRVILPALLTVAQALDPSLTLQLLAVTHAPLVLASLEPHFDEARDAVFLFQQEGPSVQAGRLDWRVRGDASAWLTSLFELGQARSVEAEQAMREAEQAMSDPSCDVARGQEIDAKLRRLLGDMDPFWVRWRFMAEKRGWRP